MLGHSPVVAFKQVWPRTGEEWTKAKMDSLAAGGNNNECVYLYPDSSRTLGTAVYIPANTDVTIYGHVLGNANEDRRSGPGVNVAIAGLELSDAPPSERFPADQYDNWTFTWNVRSSVATNVKFCVSGFSWPANEKAYVEVEGHYG